MYPPRVRQPDERCGNCARSAACGVAGALECAAARHAYPPEGFAGERWWERGGKRLLVRPGGWCWSHSMKAD